MSSKKPPIIPTSVFATDEWEGKATYRSLPSRSHAEFDHNLSPIAGQRAFHVRRLLLVAVECLMLIGLAVAFFLVVLPDVGS